MVIASSRFNGMLIKALEMEIEQWAQIFPRAARNQFSVGENDDGGLHGTLSLLIKHFSRNTLCYTRPHVFFPGLWIDGLR